MAVSREAWEQALASVKEEEIQPSDALTVQGFAEMLGLRRSWAAQSLKRLVAAGKATPTKKKMRRSDGSAIPVPAYLLVESSPKKPRHRP